MKFTGERVIPGKQDPDLFNEHRAGYLFAQRFCAGKKVLDAACGSGYGSALLAQTARSVMGVDVAAEAIEYSRAQYGSDNVQFAQADCLALPFSSGYFDVITAFEIIEHLPDAAVFLLELRRVLAPAGLLVLSTPNRLYYTEDRGEVNPFHQREFSFAEFRGLLQEHFDHRQILFQNHVAGLLVAPADDLQPSALSCGSVIAEPGPSSCTLEQAAHAAYFLVALCSQQPLPAAEPLLYLPSVGNVLREREVHIHSLQAELERLEKTLAEKGKYLLELQADYDRKVQWAMGSGAPAGRIAGRL